MNKNINDNNLSADDFIPEIDSLELPLNGKSTNLREILEGTYKLPKGDKRVQFSFFHGIPVINYKPLSAKAEELSCCSSKICVIRLTIFSMLQM